MSMTLMVRAMHLKIGNPIRKLVLIKLADNANDQGQCWPSHQHIADQCEIGKSTVRKHIRELADAGILKIENRKGPKGNSSNLYHIVIPPMLRDSTPMPPGSTPPMPPGSTGISHSLESVNESVIEPISNSDELAHQIIDIWNKIKESGGVNWQSVDARTKKRITSTNQRIKMVKSRLDDKTNESLLRWFTDFLTALSKSRFYSGSPTPSKPSGYKWEYGQIMREDTFVKAIERLNEGWDI